MLAPKLPERPPLFDLFDDLTLFSRRAALGSGIGTGVTAFVRLVTENSNKILSERLAFGAYTFFGLTAASLAAWAVCAGLRHLSMGKNQP